MGYAFDTEERNGIFVARVGGERYQRVDQNFNEAWRFWSSVASQMKERGLYRLLAILTVQGALRTLDVRLFYRRLGEMGFTAEVRIAMVFDMPPHARRVLELGVDAAARDGWTIHHFETEVDALAWL